MELSMFVCTAEEKMHSFRFPFNSYYDDHLITPLLSSNISIILAHGNTERESLSPISFSFFFSATVLVCTYVMDAAESAGVKLT